MLQNTLCVLQRWIRYSIARTDNEALPHARLRDRYPRNVPLLGGFIPRHVEHKGGWLHAVVHREPTIPDLTLIPPSLSLPLSLSISLSVKYQLPGLYFRERSFCLSVKPSHFVFSLSFWKE